MPETKEPISIRDILAKPGSKVFGFLKVAERPGSVVEMPVGIVNGLQPGPILCLSAGRHAVEYAGIDAVIRLFKETNPEELRGGLLTLPVINIPAFDTQTPYVCPVDNKNLAEIVPAKTGTLSDRIAYTVLKEIIEKADFYIDLHAADLPERLVPFTVYWETGNATVDKQSAIMARLYGTDFIARLVPPKNVGEIPSFVGEFGGFGEYDESDISGHVNGVRNVMKYLGMIEGKPILPRKQAFFTVVEQGLWNVPDETVNSRVTASERSASQALRTNRGGLLYPKAKPGDQIKQGQVVAEIRDLKGDTIEQISSPRPCTIIIMFPKHVVNEGDQIFLTATVTELPSLDLTQ